MNQTASVRSLPWIGVSRFGRLAAGLNTPATFLLRHGGNGSRTREGCRRTIRPALLAVVQFRRRQVPHTVLGLPGARASSGELPLHGLDSERTYVAQGATMDTPTPHYLEMEKADTHAGEALRTHLLENCVEYARPNHRGPPVWRALAHERVPRAPDARPGKPGIRFRLWTGPAALQTDSGSHAESGVIWYNVSIRIIE